jgi:release factor glutamine methyltransferase
LAYVVGTTGFRTIELRVDRRVLIPRPETEGLVELVLEWSAREHSGAEDWGAAADIGTGSGCVALSLAVEGRFERVIAIDCSTEALQLARQNRDAVAPATPVQFRLGEGLEPVREESLGVVVSNPPYVAPAEYEELDRGVREYEPREALVSGLGGMAHIQQLLDGAAAVLAAGGLLAIEIDSTRADLALRLARESGWPDARVERDLFARPRYLLATKES